MLFPCFRFDHPWGLCMFCESERRSWLPLVHFIKDCVFVRNNFFAVVCMQGSLLRIQPSPLALSPLMHGGWDFGQDRVVADGGLEEARPLNVFFVILWVFVVFMTQLHYHDWVPFSQGVHVLTCWKDGFAGTRVVWSLVCFDACDST